MEICKELLIFLKRKPKNTYKQSVLKKSILFIENFRKICLT